MGSISVSTPYGAPLLIKPPTETHNRKDAVRIFSQRPYLKTPDEVLYALKQVESKETSQLIRRPPIDGLRSLLSPNKSSSGGGVGETSTLRLQQQQLQQQRRLPSSSSSSTAAISPLAPHKAKTSLASLLYSVSAETNSQNSRATIRTVGQMTSAVKRHINSAVRMHGEKPEHFPPPPTLGSGIVSTSSISY